MTSENAESNVAVTEPTGKAIQTGSSTMDNRLRKNERARARRAAQKAAKAPAEVKPEINPTVEVITGQPIPEAPKPEGKPGEAPKQPKAPKEPKPKRISRPAHTALWIRDHGDGKNLKDIAKETDVAYATAGGRSKESEAYWALGYARGILEALGLISVDSAGTVKVIGKVVPV
jgi:hypothetical protein